MARRYGEDAKAQYAALDPRNAPPHIFATGEAAYRAISRKGKFKNQAIIVSGESGTWTAQSRHRPSRHHSASPPPVYFVAGSGKTVGNKLLMDYFAYRSGSAVAASEVTAKIARVMKDSNPVLEAFGNAKTTRNSNSSRFGKFQIMNFSEHGEIGTISARARRQRRLRATASSS